MLTTPSLALVFVAVAIAVIFVALALRDYLIAETKLTPARKAWLRTSGLSSRRSLLVYT
jgi:hypothetical protein